MAGYDHALDVASRGGLAPAQVIAVVSLVGGFVESVARQAGETAELQRRTAETGLQEKARRRGA